MPWSALSPALREYSGRDAIELDAYRPSVSVRLTPSEVGIVFLWGKLLELKPAQGCRRLTAAARLTACILPDKLTSLALFVFVPPCTRLGDHGQQQLVLTSSHEGHD